MQAVSRTPGQAGPKIAPTGLDYAPYPDRTIRGKAFSPSACRGTSKDGISCIGCEEELWTRKRVRRIMDVRGKRSTLRGVGEVVKGAAIDLLKKPRTKLL